MGRPKKELSAEQLAEKARKKAEKVAAQKTLDERREREMVLYVGGASFRQIAEQISRTSKEEISKSTVEKDINLLLDKEVVIGEQFIKRMRVVNIRRLNTLIMANMGGAQQGDLKKGEMVRKLVADLSELTGANMPIKLEHDHNFNPKELSDEELQRIADSKSRS